MKFPLLVRAAAFAGLALAEVLAGVRMHPVQYALLRSEDHALLAGSMLVFGVLAAGMVATRGLDWGSVSSRLRTPEPVPART